MSLNDIIKILKSRISVLEKQITRNNEESDNIIISLDEYILEKDKYIKNIQTENTELRKDNQKLRNVIYQLHNNENKVFDIFFLGM